MPTALPPFIVVDDVDTSIQYTGPWYLHRGSQDSVGEVPYLNTLHGVNANASLAFAFSGTHIRLYGTYNFANISGVLDPTWECSVDNSSIGKNPSRHSMAVANNGDFCEFDKLSDGPHVLTVNATILRNQTFWVDDIQYAPSASIPLDQASILIDSLDSQLQYGEGWNYSMTSDNVSVHMTTVLGSIFTYDFIGVSVTWFGGYGSMDRGLSPSPASYSIDGQTPIGFTLASIQPFTTWHQVIFKTAQHTAGPHTLKVVYEGGSNSTALRLQYLIVQNDTLSSTTILIEKSLSTPTGAIAGGVIGGLALVILALLWFLLLRRRQGHAAQQRGSLSTPTRVDYTLLPSNAAASGGMEEKVYYASMPGLTSTDVSRSIEPLGTSSGVVPYPTNLHPVPLQQAALALANPSLSSLPGLVSSVPSPLPDRTGREAETGAPLRPQKQGNPSVPVSVQNNDIQSLNVV